MISDKLNFDITLYTENTTFSPSYDEVRIFMLVDGHCILITNETSTDMYKSDYYLINVFETAEIRTSPNTYLAVLSIPYGDLLKGTGRSFARFRLRSSEATDNRYREIRVQILGLIRWLMEGVDKNRFAALGLYYLVLQSLISNFMVNEEKDSQQASPDEKITEILQYILLNYRSEISIQDIVDKFFLSRSSVSRMLKAYTGENFPDFIKKLRLNVVREELENTELSVTDIAMNAGFSSLSVLNRAFKESFGMTPTEYRTRIDRSPDATDKMEDKEERSQVLQLLEQAGTFRSAEDEVVEVVDIQADKGTPFSGWKNRILSVGFFSSALSAKMQEQILLIRERLHIEYLRLWNPFSSNMLFYNLKEGTYNFFVLDQALDFCVDHSFKVCIDLTPRRERILANARTEILGISGETEFYSADEWLKALYNFLNHLKNRYREDALSGWIFEFSFFLNDSPYYISDDYDPIKLMDDASEMIRSMIPDPKIAGPGLAPEEDPSVDLDKIERFLTSQKKHPDIFTSIHFPYVSHRINEYSGSYSRKAYRFYLQQETERIRKKLEQLGFKGEYWIMEHGISIANRNYLQDSCYRGAEIVDSFISTYNNVDTVGVFYASDLLGAYIDSGSVLLGSGGIMTYQGIRKPSFFAYRFLHHLGRRLLYRNEHCLVTSNNEKDIRILCWNKKVLGPKYYMQEEDSFNPKEIEGLFENLDGYAMEFKIKGIPTGQKMLIRQQVVNKDHGSVLDKWITLGGLKELNRDDLEYLNQTAVPEVSLEEFIQEEDPLQISVKLEPNEIRLIRITGIS